MNYRVTGGKEQNAILLFIAFVGLFIGGALLNSFVIEPLTHSLLGNKIGVLLVTGALGLYVYSRHYDLHIEGSHILMNNFFYKIAIPFSELELLEINLTEASIKIKQSSVLKPWYVQLKHKALLDSFIQECKSYQLAFQEK